MNCPNCGSENRDDARFCAGCGAALDGAGDVRRRVYRDRDDDWCFGTSGGALPGLIIGAIIIMVGMASVFGRNFGETIGSWGESFGEGMGRWGESFGEGIGRFFADWGTSWGAQIGAFFMIVFGLAIVFYVLYGKDRW